MRLERIVLHNFRQYLGTQELKFACGDTGNVTVIHGVNGAGKTGLFLALNWCLYGRGSEKVKVIDNVGELISKGAVAGASDGETVAAYVEVYFTHEGRKFYIKRSMSGVKIKDSLKPNSDDVVMSVTNSDGITQPVVDPYARINQIMPPNVRTYFLFDGEKIDNFSKPSASQEVKDAIYLVLRLEVLKRAKAHLEAVAKDYRGELKNSASKELATLAEREEKAWNHRERHQEDLADFTVQSESARRKIDDISQKLRELEATKELQLEREHIEERRAEYQEELDSRIIKPVAKGTAEGYFVAFRPAVDKALALLDSKRQRGELPGNIRQQFVQDLLDRNACICGRSLDQGTTERSNLEGLLREGTPEAIEASALEAFTRLSSIVVRIDTRAIEIGEHMTRRAQVADAIDEADRKLFDLKKQLEDFPIEQIRALETQRTEFEEDRQSLQVKAALATQSIELLTKELEGIKDERKHVEKKEVHERTLSTKLELAEQAASAIGEIWDKFADSMRVEIEAKTKEIFSSLAWKESHFTDVRLSTEYHLEVLDRWGKPARAELSAGERQVLSLSFIAAMSRLGEKDAPLVIDTPFGRLSENHRNSITKHLPDLAKQLVLLVTDEELRDEALANIHPRIGAEYRLVWNRDASSTLIEKVK